MKGGNTRSSKQISQEKKGSRANLLSLLHLFLLSPRSLLRNTFRGPRYRFALFCRGGSPCPPDNFHLLCVKEIHAVF